MAVIAGDAILVRLVVFLVLGMALMFGFFFPCRFAWLHAR